MNTFQGPLLETLIFFEISYYSYQAFNFLPYQCLRSILFYSVVVRLHQFELKNFSIFCPAFSAIIDNIWPYNFMVSPSLVHIHQ